MSPLVEIVCTEQTSDETVDIMFQVLKKSGKRPDMLGSKAYTRLLNP
ncbi:MAG: hypothetical protein FI723_01305 [SAR202 cluster bacterium]|nr:hypothetical protein [SAR202 cluster bacterium]